jgi:hypothetical protein
MDEGQIRSIAASAVQRAPRRPSLPMRQKPFMPILMVMAGQPGSGAFSRDGLSNQGHAIAEHHDMISGR